MVLLQQMLGLGLVRKHCPNDGGLNRALDVAVHGNVAGIVGSLRHGVDVLTRDVGNLLGHGHSHLCASLLPSEKLDVQLAPFSLIG